jgi:hypothetical protein
MYEREIDLMDDCLSPKHTPEHYGQKKNPKDGETIRIARVPQAEESIIDFVVEQMVPALEAGE